MQPVTDWTTPVWPANQRFDFLLRKRILTREEAADLKDRLAKNSPYRRIATKAIQELTNGANRPTANSQVRRTEPETDS